MSFSSAVVIPVAALPSGMTLSFIPMLHPEPIYIVVDGYLGATGTYSLTVNTYPTVVFSPIPISPCENDAPLLVSGGSPAGGTYTGTGVSGNLFDPSLAGSGTHIITYTYTDSSGCSNVDTASITVNSLPSVSVSPVAPLCEEDGAVQLSGSPAGGSFSGSGISGGLFDPQIAGVGTHTIIYTYIDPIGCANADSVAITVDALPNVDLTSISPLCESASPVQLLGSPTGGTFGGAGVSGSTFDPAAAGVGTHMISYTFTNANGCTDSDTTLITVDPLPAVSLQPIDGICTNGPIVQLDAGTPTGGNYSGTGVGGTQFDPSLAGQGLHLITYTFTDANGCTNADTTSIRVFALPLVGLAPLDSVCVDHGLLQLSGGMPAGGIYLGVNVSNGLFDPAAAGVGPDFIYYSFTDTNGCTDSAEESITVNPLPPQPSVVMTNDSVLTSSTSGESYQWYLNGVPLPDSVSQSLIPSDSGEYQVEIVDTNGCSSLSEMFPYDPPTVAIDPLFAKTLLNIYPNPSGGAVFVSVENLPLSQGLSISIHDMRGRKVLEKSLDRGNSFVESIDLASQAEGVYLIQLSYKGSAVKLEKLILQD